MNIEFGAAYEVDSNTLGVNFEANVEGKSVVCAVSLDALGALDNGNSGKSAEQQFLAHRAFIECVAEAKILTGAQGRVDITRADVECTSNGAT